MIKKFADQDLESLHRQLSRLKIAEFGEGLYALYLDTVAQLPDGAVIEPAENPRPDTDLEHLGTYKQFHIFIGL
jgi:hypothetical protein